MNVLPFLIYSMKSGSVLVYTQSLFSHMNEYVKCTFSRWKLYFISLEDTLDWHTRQQHILATIIVTGDNVVQNRCGDDP